LADALTLKLVDRDGAVREALDDGLSGNRRDLFKKLVGGGTVLASGRQGELTHADRTVLHPRPADLAVVVLRAAGVRHERPLDRAVSRAQSHYRLEPRGGSGTNPLVRAT
jgi:hypothetical protein